MADWQDYQAAHADAQHTVVGSIKVLRDVESPQLGNRRDILVYLPPSYAEGNRRYPVIYMHDGQNLFDASTSFAGEWGVDQTLEAASAEGVEAIVVAIPNIGPERTSEYSPFVDPKAGGGKGDQYLAFIRETLKPLVDVDFRTLPDRHNTGIAGSSMGGLISLYGFVKHPETFGFVAAMSPSLWFANRAMLDYIEKTSVHQGRIYLDVGMKEGQKTLDDVLRLRDILISKGFRMRRDMLLVVDTAGEHNERAWGRRIRRVLEFLLAVRRHHGRQRSPLPRKTTS